MVRVKTLQNRRILLGVTGGIAAYKAAELLRQCQTLGAEVKVVMTQGATEFVTPLTFQALSGSPVHTQLLNSEEEAAMGHINLARWADMIVIAPASANSIARLASGAASDLLSTVVLATEKPVMIVPAMNRAMYADEATQQNIEQLTQRGLLFEGPAEGLQACGETGAGRMIEPLEIVDAIVAFFQTGVLAGVNVLISAGPTREAIDPVRYISNHSSGKMGFAIAQACADAGANVTLVAGPVQLETPSGVERVDVVSADEMAQAIFVRAVQADVFIATAAVADYSPKRVSANKVKKNNNELTLELVKTTDILLQVSNGDAAPFCVGFAAETDDLEKYARSKLEKKSLDMIAANWVGQEGGGFNSDDNSLHVFWKEGERQLESMPKTILAHKLTALIAEKYHEKDTA